MLESFAMNRPMNNNEIEVFLRSFSYAQICQELATGTGDSNEIHVSNQINENHPAFYHHELPTTDAFNLRQNQANIDEANKGAL